MEYARQLILDTDNTLDEIAMLLGYNSQQSFTTAFKNHWGYSPGWIRRGGVSTPNRFSKVQLSVRGSLFTHLEHIVLKHK